MKVESQKTEQNKQQSTKHTYQTPQFFIYGDVREITRNLGEKGVVDGGGGAAMGPKTGT